MTDTDRIAEIRARAEAATPGPWKKNECEGYDEIYDANSRGKRLAPLAMVGVNPCDTNFIAHAREDIPYLLEQLAQAREGCERCDIARRDFELSQSLEYVDRAAMLDKIHTLQEQLAKAEAEVDRLREAQRWTPITEGPPNSGEHVWLCCEIRPGGKKYVCDGYYAAPKTITSGCDDELATEYDEEADEYYLLEGWYEVIKNWDDYSSISIEDFVTHWMLLPAPPEEGEPK